MPVRPHLFERFYREEAERKSDAPGMGPGLAICKRITEKLEGRLTLKGAPGLGAAFTDWLKPAQL
jgi:two-component system capsular synthesis sensor histidine kinase RcsC